MDVFQEAEKNTQKPIEIITADAWGATQSLATNLKRQITLIIHKHKKPYEKVVIKKYAYDDDTRITTTIGLKSDFCKKRKKREYFYSEKREQLTPPQKRKLGRPKGVKNGQGKKKKNAKVKKKRGRKGLFTVFDKGKKGYAKVDPYRKTVRVGKDIPNTVSAALGDVVKLYAKNFIQNNLAEHKNSVISNNLVLSGPKGAKTAERGLRAFFICRNNPQLLKNLQITHQFQKNFILRQIKECPLLPLWMGTRMIS